MISVLSPLISRAPSPFMDTVLLVVLSSGLIGVASLLAVLAEAMSKWTCPHDWMSRGIYGDERQQVGHTKEWLCPNCGKHTYKDPFK